MNQHQLSTGAQRALEQAQTEATRLGHEQVGAEHIVLALVGESSAGADVLRRLGVDPAEARRRLEATAGRGRPRAGASTGPAGAEGPTLTSYAKRLIDAAAREARGAGTDVSVEHLFAAAALDPRGALAKVFADAGVGAEQVRQEVSGGRPSPKRERTKRPRSTERDTSPASKSTTSSQAAGSPAARATQPARPAAPPPAPRLDVGAARPPRWRYVLLLAVPISMVLAWVVHAPAIWVFIVACLGVLPLASYMGEATEHLAHRTGPTVGGLLNATFGNAAELIIAVVALRAGMVDLVKASITGSILGNLLLILGLAIIAGGLGRPQFRFNRTNAGMSAGMLALAVVAMVFPALFHATHPGAAAAASELRMSEAVSVILLATYGCSLLFTLRTHKALFGGDPHPLDVPVWSVGKAVAILAVATVGVAIQSEILVHAVEASTEAFGLSPLFVGLIIVPIIGNAAEHAAAITFARKGQIDLGLQIALGSSTQIALLVAPLLVFVGLFFGQNMNLVFQPFEVMALGMATLVTAIITLDGESHWFEGVQLLAVYAMVAVAAYFV